MIRQETPAAEFSRPVPVEQIGVQETARKIAANAAERARLADRFDFVALDRLEAELWLQRQGSTVRVRGRLVADLTQTCVVTLDPVPASVEQEVNVLFSAGRDDGAAEHVIDMAAADPPEPIVGGCIDLGETVAQQLAMAVDPYPRSPAAAAVAAEAADEPAVVVGSDRVNPFQVLTRLRK